jgi:hypothetical protein
MKMLIALMFSLLTASMSWADSPTCYPAKAVCSIDQLMQTIHRYGAERHDWQLQSATYVSNDFGGHDPYRCVFGHEDEYRIYYTSPANLKCWASVTFSTGQCDEGGVFVPGHNCGAL